MASESRPGSVEMPSYASSSTSRSSSSQQPLVSSETMEESSMFDNKPFTLKWYHLAVLLSLDSIGAFASDAYIVNLADAVEDLNTTTALASLTIQLNWIVSGISTVFLGGLSDVYGRRSVTFGSVLVFIVGCIGCALSTSLGVFFLFRLIQAIGEGSSIIASAVVRDVEDDIANRMKWMGILAALKTLVFFIAPILGGIFGYYIGWKSLFYLIASWGFITLLGFMFLLPETAPRAISNLLPQPSEYAPPRRLSFWTMVRDMFRDRFFLLTTFFLTMYMTSIYSMLSCITYVFVNYYGLTTVEAAFCLAILPLLGAASVVANLNLSHRFKKIQTVLEAGMIWNFISIIPMILSLSFKWYSDSIAGSLVPIMIFITGAFFNFPLLGSLQLHNLKHISGAAAGFANMLFASLGAVLSIFASCLFDGSPVVIFSTIIACFLAIQLVYWPFFRKLTTGISARRN